MKRIAMVETNMSGSGFRALRIAREMGLRVVFVTRNLSLYESVPGAADFFRDYVDDVVRCETNDVDELTRAVGEYRSSHPLDALLTFGEYHIANVTESARRLGYLGSSPDAVRTARNKNLTRLRCAAASLPMPRFSIVSDVEQAVRCAGEIGFPCIVKPADESGSIDVAICFGPDEVRERAQAIVDAPFNYRGQRRSPLMLVEEYVLGHEVSVEAVTHRGRTTVLAVTDKLLSGLPRFVEMGHALPSALPGDVVAACAAMATDALAAIGFDFGVSHVEVKVGAQGPRLMEINPRPGGDRIPELLELSTGVSLLRETIRMHLGLEPCLQATANGAAAIRFLAAAPGMVNHIRGLELARSIPGIVEIGLETSPGRIVPPLHDAHARAAYAIATGLTTYQACRTAETALTQIWIDTASPVPVPGP